MTEHTEAAWQRLAALMGEMQGWHKTSLWRGTPRDSFLSEAWVDSELNRKAWVNDYRPWENTDQAIQGAEKVAMKKRRRIALDFDCNTQAWWAWIGDADYGADRHPAAALCLAIAQACGWEGGDSE